MNSRTQFMREKGESRLQLSLTSWMTIAESWRLASLLYSRIVGHLRDVL